MLAAKAPVSGESGLESDTARLSRPDLIPPDRGRVCNRAIERTTQTGILCLAGISSGGHKLAIDVSLLNRTMVLENDVVFGTVNANRRYYEAVADALAKADPEWLGRPVSRRVPLERWLEALVRRPNDVKIVIDFMLQGRPHAVPH
jgi:glucose 1-dehydrogenase